MKRIIILGIVLVLLCSLSYAFTDNSTAYYEFENDLNDTGLKGYKNQLKAAEGGASYDAADGKPDSSLECDGGDRYVNHTFQGPTEIRGITFWVKDEGSDDNDAYFEIGDSGGAASDIFQLKKRVTGNYHIWYYKSGALIAEGDLSQAVTNGEWHMFTFNMGGGGFQAYIDNNTVADLNDASTDTFNADFNDLYVCGGYLGNRASAQIDNLFISGTRFSSQDIIDMYNSNHSLDLNEPAAGDDDKINITEPLPTTNTQYSKSTIDINATVNSTYLFNATLWLGKDGATPTSNITIYDLSNGTNTFVNFTVDLDDGNWSYYINVSSGDQSEESNSAFFYLDTIDPAISVSSTLNNTVSYDGYVQASVELSDTNLYAINITIDGTTIVHNATNIDSPYYYNLSFKPSDFDLSLGVHTLTIWAADTHTTNEIGKYNYRKSPLSKAITYNFNNDWIEVKPTNKGMFSNFDTWKQKDRYVFEYNRDSTSKLLYGNDLEFQVSSSQPIEIISNSNYRGHMIVYELQKWIDFETDYGNADVVLTRVNDNTVNVLVRGIDANNIVFNSLGGLNVVNQTYKFYYGNFTETYTESALETASTTFSLNFTRNETFVNDINATLVFNNTLYSPTKTSYGDYIYFTTDIGSSLVHKNVTNTSFYWVWNVTGLDAYSNTTTEHNQSRYKMIVSNCTTLLSDYAYSLNFTTINSSGLKINTDVEALFTVWNSSSTLFRTYSMEYGDSNYHQFCMHPNTTNSLNVDYEVIFSASGYNNRNFIIANSKLNNTLTDYEIELALTGETTAITTTVVDENDNGLENYVIEVYRYNLATDTYNYIDSKTTNSEGVGVFNLDVSSDEYKFEVYNTDGVLKYTEPKQLLISTSYTFRIILGTTVEDITIKLQELDYTLDADRTTKNFTLVWEDSPTNIIDSINLTVIKTNLTNDVLVYSSVSTADSGNLYYNVSENGVYVAKVYVTSTEDGNTYFLDSVSIDIREAYDLFGTDALIMAFLFIITMAFVGLVFSGEVALILTIFGIIIFYLLGALIVSLSGIIAILISAALIAFRLKKER